jgi:hypothetical protein
MKTFDEAVVAVNVLEAPVTWVMAMHEATGAAVEDLEDYARRRVLWAGVTRGERNGVTVLPCIREALKYLLGMEHLQ